MNIETKSICVVGIGGLGCAVLPYLAAAGIGRIGMIDFDRIELSNLARQPLFGRDDVGHFKVDVAEQYLQKLFPAVGIQAHRCMLIDENALQLLESYDLVLDATDNLTARLAINDACGAMGKPWIYGSVDRWHGQVSLFLPGQLDYRQLFPDGPVTHVSSACSVTTVLGPFVSLVGSIQAVEAIRLLAHGECGLGGKLLLIDGRTWRFTTVALVPQGNECEISHSQLQRWLELGICQLVDVRVPLEELRKEAKVVLYCQSGCRSLILARQLRQNGFDAYSLQGGVCRYSLSERRNPE